MPRSRFRNSEMPRSRFRNSEMPRSRFRNSEMPKVPIPEFRNAQGPDSGIPKCPRPRFRNSEMPAGLVCGIPIFCTRRSGGSESWDPRSWAARNSGIVLLAIRGSEICCPGSHTFPDCRSSFKLLYPVDALRITWPHILMDGYSWSIRADQRTMLGIHCVARL